MDLLVTTQPLHFEDTDPGVTGQGLTLAVEKGSGT